MGDESPAGASLRDLQKVAVKPSGPAAIISLSAGSIPTLSGMKRKATDSASSLSEDPRSSRSSEDEMMRNLLMSGAELGEGGSSDAESDDGPLPAAEGATPEETAELNAELERTRRIKHKDAEKKRRVAINRSLKVLESLLPHTPGRKYSKAAVLVRSIEFIRSVRTLNHNLLEENRNLQMENTMLKGGLPPGQPWAPALPFRASASSPLVNFSDLAQVAQQQRVNQVQTQHELYHNAISAMRRAHQEMAPRHAHSPPEFEDLEAIKQRLPDPSPEVQQRMLFQQQPQQQQTHQQHQQQPQQQHQLFLQHQQQRQQPQLQQPQPQQPQPQQPQQQQPHYALHLYQQEMNGNGRQEQESENPDAAEKRPRLQDHEATANADAQQRFCEQQQQRQMLQHHQQQQQLLYRQNPYQYQQMMQYYQQMEMQHQQRQPPQQLDPQQQDPQQQQQRQPRDYFPDASSMQSPPVLPSVSSIQMSVPSIFQSPLRTNFND